MLYNIDIMIRTTFQTIQSNLYVQKPGRLTTRWKVVYTVAFCALLGLLMSLGPPMYGHSLEIAIGVPLGIAASILTRTYLKDIKGKKHSCYQTACISLFILGALGVVLSHLHPNFSLTPEVVFAGISIVSLVNAIRLFTLERREAKKKFNEALRALIWDKNLNATTSLNTFAPILRDYPDLVNTPFLAKHDRVTPFEMAIDHNNLEAAFVLTQIGADTQGVDLFELALERDDIETQVLMIQNGVIPSDEQLAKVKQKERLLKAALTKNPIVAVKLIQIGKLHIDRTTVLTDKQVLHFLEAAIEKDCPLAAAQFQRVSEATANIILPKIYRKIDESQKNSTFWSAMAAHIEYAQEGNQHLKNLEEQLFRTILYEPSLNIARKVTVESLKLYPKEINRLMLQAVEKNHHQALKLLIQAGGNVNQQSNGESFLLKALQHEPRRCALLLLEQGATIDDAVRNEFPSEKREHPSWNEINEYFNQRN